MMELKTVLEVALKNANELQTPPAPQYYCCLVKDIESLGWDKLSFVDTEFSTIKLKIEDSSGREHLITLKLNAKYPNEAPDCCVDFPVPFAVTWTPQSSLQNIHNQLSATLESLKHFWDALDEIDEKTWVLEPEKPTRSATIRRIAIGNNVSVTIDVDPRHPTMLPECYFLGAEHEHQMSLTSLGAGPQNPPQHREETECCSRQTGGEGKFQHCAKFRDPENGLLQNLKDVLEIEFPSRSNLEKSDFSMDCGICYAYRLDSAIPDQVCDDPRCGQPFHQACLYEWLRGLPSSRQSFNIIYGECPYCSKPITLKMSNKKS
ncbi:E3 ubiquitin-protein ligase FANCL isoform X3 [Ascaphus truei]